MDPKTLNLLAEHAQASANTLLQIANGARELQALLSRKLELDDRIVSIVGSLTPGTVEAVTGTTTKVAPPRRSSGVKAAPKAAEQFEQVGEITPPKRPSEQAPEATAPERETTTVVRSSEKLKPGSRVYIKSKGVWGQVFRAWRNQPGCYRVDVPNPATGEADQIKAHISDLSLTGPETTPPEGPKGNPTPTPKASEPSNVIQMPKPKEDTPKAEAGGPDCPATDLVVPENNKKPKPEKAGPEKARSTQEQRDIVFAALLELNPTPEKPLSTKDLASHVADKLTLTPAYFALLDLAAAGLVKLSETGHVLSLVRKVDPAEALGATTPKGGDDW